MKKNLLLVLFLTALLQTDGYAQWINSINITPSHPTSIDTIQVYVDCSFPSGGCDPYLNSVFVSGNDIYGDALHCLGMLTVICSYTDTFSVAPLAPGIYTFHMQLNAGGGPAPCTAGIVPGPVDSASFAVTQATGIPPIDRISAFKVIQDAGTDGLTILVPSHLLQDNMIFSIYSPDGRSVLTAAITETSTLLHAHLANGIYVASLQTGTARYQKKVALIK